MVRSALKIHTHPVVDLHVTRWVYACEINYVAVSVDFFARWRDRCVRTILGMIVTH